MIPETIGPSSEALNLVTWGDFQFAVWYTLAGELRIGRIQRGVHRWGLDHVEYEFAGTPRTVLALPRANDGHNIAAIAVDGLGKIHVWANMHFNEPRVVVTTAAHDTDGWLATAGWTSEATGFPSMDPDHVTYPFPTHLPGGSLIFYARDQGGSGASDARFWRRAATGTTWTGPTLLFQGMGVPDAKGPGVPGETYGEGDTEHNWSPYPSGPIVVEPDRFAHPGRLHMCWVWRLFALDSDRLNVLPSYAYSDDNATSWRAIDGTAVTLPITPLNNIACRFPGHARILSITRDGGGIVGATIDQTAASAGINVGSTYMVQVPADSSFDAAVTIAAVDGADLIWGQGGASASATFSGYIGRDDYQNGQGLTVSSQGYPHIFHSNTPTWWTRWDGTAWTSTSLPTSINGQVHAGAANSAFWMRGQPWLLQQRGGPGWRRPAAFNLAGPSIVTLGGPVYADGGHEASYDPEAYRRFGTIEVLTCNGNRPRVFTYGPKVARRAAA